MQKELNNVFELELTTLTPVSIGTGEVKYPLSDFILRNNQVIYINHEAIEKALEKRSESILKEYLDNIQKSLELEESKDEKEYKGNYETLITFLKSKLQLTENQFTKTSYPAKEVRFSSKIQIYELLKNAGKPYIAGSTIKGALKTAILYDWLLDKENGRRKLQDFGGICIEIVNVAIPKIQEHINKRNKLFKEKQPIKEERGKLYIRMKNGKENREQLKLEIKPLSDKIKEVNKEIKKIKNEIVKLIEQDINKIDQEFDKLNECIFGNTKEKDARMDFSLLQVSDTNPLSENIIEIRETKRYHLLDNNEGIIQIKEVLGKISSNEAKLKFVLDTNIIFYKNHKDTIERKFLNPDLDYLNQNKQNLIQLFEKINQFSLASIDYELESSVPYQSILREIKKEIKNSKNYCAYLRIGSGKTYFDNSIGLALKHVLSDNEFNQFRELYSLFPEQSIFPVTRTIIASDKSPMGWIKLEDKNNPKPLSKPLANGDIIEAKIYNIGTGYTMAIYCDQEDNEQPQQELQLPKSAKKDPRFKVGASVKAEYQKGKVIKLIFKSFL